MVAEKSQKIYAHVDESGQDIRSNRFIVVVVLSTTAQTDLGQQLQSIERDSGTGSKKWHKLRHKNRTAYLARILAEDMGESVYFGTYRKPVSFMAAMSNVIAEAIRRYVAGKPYRATIYIDGIDKQKAQEITNVLRGSGLALGMVRSRRDESDPVIRLADMWAGCIRAAILGTEECQRLMDKAIKAGYLKETTKT